MSGQFFVVLEPEPGLELEPEPEPDVPDELEPVDPEPVDPEAVDPEFPELLDDDEVPLELVPLFPVPEPDVVGLEVAALATSAPPPTSPAVRAPVASALRRRIFMSVVCPSSRVTPTPSGGHGTACAPDLCAVVRPAQSLGGVRLRSDDDSQETAEGVSRDRETGRQMRRDAPVQRGMQPWTTSGRFPRRRCCSRPQRRRALQQ